MSSMSDTADPGERLRGMRSLGPERAACLVTNAASRSHPVTDRFETTRPCGPCMARAYGVCAAVVHSDLARLAALANIVKVSRGQVFLHEDKLADHFYILTVGSAKLYKLLHDGRRQIIAFAQVGSFLGLVASERYAFSAEAIEPSRLCRLSRSRLQLFLSDQPAMAHRLLNVAVHDLARAQEQMILLGRMTATERLASFLLFQTTCRQPRSIRPPRIHLPMSRTDVADYLGLTTETVSRSLATLKKFGAIVVPNVHEVVVLDHSALVRI